MLRYCIVINILCHRPSTPSSTIKCVHGKEPQKKVLGDHYILGDYNNGKLCDARSCN